MTFWARFFVSFVLIYVLNLSDSKGQQQLNSSGFVLLPKAAEFDNPQPDQWRSSGVAVEPADVPAWLHFRVNRPESSDASWKIEFEIGGHSTVVDSKTYLNRLIENKSSEKTVVIEVPAPKAGKINVRRSASVFTLAYVGLMRPSTVGVPLFPIGDVNLERLEDLRKNSDYRVPLFDSIVLVTYASRVQRKTCSGFQYAPGRILTAAHCVFSEYETDYPGQLSVSFGEVLSTDPEGKFRRGATIVSTGNKFGDADPWVRDYALLSVDVPPGFEKALAPLESKQLPDRSALELFQNWQDGTAGHRGGKVLSRDKDCSVIPRVYFQGAQKACPAPIYYLHGCDTEEQSSGSPVFAAGTNTVVGMHTVGYELERANCFISSTFLSHEIEILDRH